MLYAAFECLLGFPIDVSIYNRDGTSSRSEKYSNKDTAKSIDLKVFPWDNQHLSNHSIIPPGGRATTDDEHSHGDDDDNDIYSCRTTLEFRVRYRAFQYYREMRYQPKSVDLMTQRHEAFREIVGDGIYNEIIDLIKRICNARERSYLIMLRRVYHKKGRFDTKQDVPREMRNVLFNSTLLSAFMHLGCSSEPITSDSLNRDRLSEVVIEARLDLNSFELWESKQGRKWSTAATL